MSDNLETLDLLADLGTLSNTRATAKGIAIQNQMLFDAMTPEEQARVIAAAEARIAAREEVARAKRANAKVQTRIGLTIFWIMIAAGAIALLAQAGATP
jgi:hypothetical protein